MSESMNTLPACPVCGFSPSAYRNPAGVVRRIECCGLDTDWRISRCAAELKWRELVAAHLATKAQSGDAPALCLSTNYGRFGAARGFSTASDAKPSDYATPEGGDPYGAAIVSACIELHAAAGKFPRFNSGHEGYAVLLEEVRELEREVFRKDVDPQALRKEAKQVAAMALRFIGDVCDRTNEPAPETGHG